MKPAFKDASSRSAITKKYAATDMISQHSKKPKTELAKTASCIPKMNKAVAKFNDGNEYTSLYFGRYPSANNEASKAPPLISIKKKADQTSYVAAK